MLKDGSKGKVEVIISVRILKVIEISVFGKDVSLFGFQKTDNIIWILESWPIFNVSFGNSNEMRDIQRQHKARKVESANLMPNHPYSA